MKWKLLIPILCMSYGSLIAQRVAIEIEKNDFFYCGIENPITILVENVTSSNIKLETDNGIITKSGNHYIYIPKRRRNAELIIKQKVGSEYIEIKRRTFRIILLPDPIAIIGQGYHLGNRTTTWDSMRAILPNSDFDVPFKIESFTMFIKRQDRSFSNEVYNKTGHLNEEAKKLLLSVAMGDTIFFERILATGPDGITRHLKSITNPPKN